MCCQGDGLNGVLSRREVEVQTAETECFWSSSLERTSIRSSKPFTKPLSLEPTSSFSQAFLFRSSSIERTHTRSSEPLPEPWSLEPPFFFARPFLTQSSSLEWTYTRSSEPLTELCSLEPPHSSLEPSWTKPVCSSEPPIRSSARANCTEFLGLF